MIKILILKKLKDSFENKVKPDAERTGEMSSDDDCDDYKKHLLKLKLSKF